MMIYLLSEFVFVEHGILELFIAYFGSLIVTSS